MVLFPPPSPTCAAPRSLARYDASGVCVVLTITTRPDLVDARQDETRERRRFERNTVSRFRIRRHDRVTNLLPVRPNPQFPALRRLKTSRTQTIYLIARRLTASLQF